MFRSLGSDVTLIVSRQQVLPGKDPEVAAALEAEFLRRGVRLYKGARAAGIEVDGPIPKALRRSSATTDGWPPAPTPCWPSGRSPTATGSASTPPGSPPTPAATSRSTTTSSRTCRHIYAAGDLSGKLPLSSVASMQGRKIAEHVMGLHTRQHRHLDYEKAASAIFTEPEIADVGLAEAEAFAEGRKLRVTKVPFSANAKALIEGDSRGFVKIISDPATGVVLGGSIVGRGAAELISVIALAVTTNLKVVDLVDSVLVHPALSESLADAAE